MGIVHCIRRFDSDSEMKQQSLMAFALELAPTSPGSAVLQLSNVRYMI